MFASLDFTLVHKLVVVFLSLALILTSLFASLIVVLLLVSTTTASTFSTLVVALTTCIACLLVVAVALFPFAGVVLSGFLSYLNDCDLTFVIEIACGGAHRIDRGLRSQLVAILFFILGDIL